MYAKHGTNQAIFAKTSLQYSNRAMGHLPCTSMIFPFRCPSIGDFMGFLIAMFDYWRVIGFSPMSYIYIYDGEIMGNLTTSWYNGDILGFEWFDWNSLSLRRVNMAFSRSAAASASCCIIGIHHCIHCRGWFEISSDYDGQLLLPMIAGITMVGEPHFICSFLPPFQLGFLM